MLLSGTCVLRAQGREQLENRLLDAVQYYENGQYARAGSLLRAITEKDPACDAAWYYLGLCEARQGRLEPAIDNLEKAVGLDSANFWYMDRLALLYRSAGNAPKVIGLYEEMLRRHPKKTDVYFDLLYLYCSSSGRCGIRGRT